MKIYYKNSAALILIGFVLLITGCVDLTTTQYARLEKTIHPNRYLYSQNGRVYSMRGLLGVWSRGMDVLARRCRREIKVDSISMAAEEWPRLAQFIITQRQRGNLEPPLILIGHSLGAEDQIRVAWALKRAKIPVALLVTIDPVSPQVIPANVMRVVNIYKSVPGQDNVPLFRGIRLRVANGLTSLENIDIRITHVGFDTSRLDHFNIDDSRDIQNMVMNEIRKTLASY